MPDPDHLTQELALQWVIRTRDPTFADWDGLTAWLEADLRHAQAFDRLSLMDHDLAAALADAPVEPAADSVAAATVGRARGGRPRRSRRPVRTPAIWTAAALAACLLISFGLLRPGGILRPQLTIEAPADRMRTTDWGVRGEVDLAPGGRVVFDRRLDGVATLAKGSAVFRIRHDPTRPVVVEVGEARLVDLGTVFSVHRTAQGLELAVREGRVRYEGSGRKVDLGPGQSLSAVGDRVLVQPSSGSPPAADASRPAARLTYDHAPLSRVAADLSRAGVLPVTASPTVASRTFTGTLALGGDPAALRRRLALLLGVDLRPQGEEWVMTATSGRAGTD